MYKKQNKKNNNNKTNLYQSTSTQFMRPTAISQKKVQIPIRDI